MVAHVQFATVTNQNYHAKSVAYVPTDVHMCKGPGVQLKQLIMTVWKILKALMNQIKVSLNRNLTNCIRNLMIK